MPQPEDFQNDSYIEIEALGLKIRLNNHSPTERLNAYAQIARAMHETWLIDGPRAFPQQTLESFEKAFTVIIKGLHELSDIGRDIDQARRHMQNARTSIGVAIVRYGAIKTRLHSIDECFESLYKALYYIEPLTE